ncbi:MAG: glutamate-5-semialdehyde dehydrogenase [Raoultibacter sp.]
MSTVTAIAQAAKRASKTLATTSGAARAQALCAMAHALRDQTADILACNARDMQAARGAATSEALLDRLLLTEGRIDEMAQALETLAAADDPLGCVQLDRRLENGLHIQRISVPLGLVAMVYEARPNVTADAAGICIKTGNAVVLRGGSLAAHSCVKIAQVLHAAAVDAGMPENCIRIIETTDRAATDELMGLHGVVDVLVPRGGAGLIRHCVETAKVPVIETGVGNCHIYVHAAANLAQATAIVLNAKCQRPGVCNAAESLLVDAAVAAEALASILPALAAAGVAVHGDAAVQAAGSACGVDVIAATQADWATEYLAPEISAHVVENLEAALAHIDAFGTGHSEAIITEDAAAAQRFLTAVDAAAVYVNASTRFTDGAQFGLGAEIGISTQKLHARGPFAAAALTSYKYVVHGTGQVRP